MAQIKLITPGAQNFHELPAVLIKRSSRGLIGADRQALEKRASALFAHMIDGMDVHPDEPLVHLLAIGATEDYGRNRNGDGFDRHTCNTRHQTFQKHAFFYRNHQNKDPRKSYGLVKLSAYNPAMHRVELVISLNGSPAAAKRNNGLFADEEMQKLASGKVFDVSMACRVPFDVCSWCGNKAPTREDYCDSTENGGMCKAGGLKHNIGSLVEIDGELHHLGADNPGADFFDISRVLRGADRIAHATGILKAAGYTNISGAQLAEAMGVTVPYALLIDGGLPSHIQNLLKQAYELADLEQEAPRAQACCRAAVVKSAEFHEPPPHHIEKFAQVLRALADHQICLPLPQFIAMTTGYSMTKAAHVAEVVQAQMHGIYGRLLTRDDFETRISNNPYTPAPSAAPAFRKWAEKQAADFSLAPQHVTRRAQLTAIRGVDFNANFEIKTAVARDSVERLAEEYALYKLAYLCALPENVREEPLTKTLVILQNCIR